MGQTLLQATVRDITEQKRAEEELRKILDETGRVNRLMQGRETRIVELKREVNALRRGTGPWAGLQERG